MTDNMDWIKRQKAPVKEMQKMKLRMKGSQHIRDDNGLTFYSVTGNQQSGKSAYGMCILSELYNNDADAILNQVVMTAKEFAEKIDDALTNKFRHKCIMWDDASVTGSAAKWMTDPKMVMYLAALGDTLAVATKSIIMTSPSGDMTKAFRNYQKYIIQISMGRHLYDRNAKAYFIGKSPMAQRWCRAEFTDPFDVRLPFYQRYAEKRENLSLQAVKDMKGMFVTKTEEDSLTGDKVLEQFIIRQYEKGEHCLSSIAKNVNKNLDFITDPIGHQKVGRILDAVGLRA